MRSSRFAMRNENQAVDANRPVKSVAVAKRNPLAEIHRRPLQPTGSADANVGPAKVNAVEPQCMDVDEEPHQLVVSANAARQALVQGGDQAAAVLQLEADQALVAKYQQLPDVDAMGSDWRDAQLVSCYVKEIFSYLRTLEPVQQVRQDYLCQPARLEITPRMHRILFDWLVQVHNRYNLLPETLYMALHIIDYYMTVDGRDISKGNYQLLGISAMFLAAKYEEIYPPFLADFVALTERTCTESQVCSMERRLLTRLDFFFGYPQPILFLRRFSRVSGATAEVHDSAKFLAELGRCNYDMVHLPPSGLAAAAFCLAVELLAESGRVATLPRSWIPELEVFSGYAKADLVPALRLLAKTVLQAYGDKQKYMAVRRKYESRQFQMVSNYPEFSDQSSRVLLEYSGSA